MNGTPFLVAGYALTWGVLAWYAWRLERRSREARRALEAMRRRDREAEAAG